MFVISDMYFPLATIARFFVSRSCICIESRWRRKFVVRVLGNVALLLVEVAEMRKVHGDRAF